MDVLEEIIGLEVNWLGEGAKDQGVIDFLG